MNEINVTMLHIWLTENGGKKAVDELCKNAEISHATLSRILAGSTVPRFGTRYKIFKFTGVSLCDRDKFKLIATENAS